jgi:hypothetical protein
MQFMCTVGPEEYEKVIERKPTCLHHRKTANIMVKNHVGQVGVTFLPRATG